MRAIVKLFLLAAMFLGFNQAHATEELRVGVSTFDPLVVQDGPVVKGFEIELWNQAATMIGRSSKFEVVTFNELLSGVESGRFDAGIAGVSITSEREQRFDFSYPTTNGSIGILVTGEHGLSMGAAIESLLKPEVMRPIIYLILFIVICGHVVWYVERGETAIDDKYFPGIFEAFWWGFVTMTTVGYGDIAPKKWTGRIAAVMVMMSGIMFFGWFVAVLSTSFNFERLEASVLGADDLAHKTVITKAGTTSESYLKKLGSVNLVTVDNIDEAFDRFEKGGIQAVVFDRPVLEYYLATHRRPNMMILDDQILPHHYGFVLPKDSDLREELDHALLQLRESGAYFDTYQRWFRR